METIHTHYPKKAGLQKPASSKETVKTDEIAMLTQISLPPGYVNDGFFVKPLYGNYRIKIHYEEILWIEADNNYSHIHFRQENKPYVTVAFNIRKVESMLPIRYFARANRSEIINLKYVWEYYGYTIFLSGTPHQFVVSEPYRKYIFSCFTELSKKTLPSK